MESAFLRIQLIYLQKHAVELFDLDMEYRTQYLQEMTIVAQAVKKAFNAEKINYECLGNGDVHLHWHIFPRTSGDLGNFGDNGKGPVWWLPKEIMWDDRNKPTPEELETMKEKLKLAIEEII